MLDFDKYKGTIPYPTKPVKPFLRMDKSPSGKNPTLVANDYRRYADELDKYEISMEEWLKLVDLWWQDQLKMESLFKADVLRENSIISIVKILIMTLRHP